MPKRALIVIDVQNEYFDGALPISDPPTETSLANIGRAMDAATEAGVPVIVVRHGTKRPVRGHLPRGLARLGAASRDRAPPARLPDREDAARLVHGHGARRACSRQAGVDTVAITGYMTHMCVDTTSRQAAHRGLARRDPQRRHRHAPAREQRRQRRRRGAAPLHARRAGPVLRRRRDDRRLARPPRRLSASRRARAAHHQLSRASPARCRPGRRPARRGSASTGRASGSSAAAAARRRRPRRARSPGRRSRCGPCRRRPASRSRRPARRARIAGCSMPKMPSSSLTPASVIDEARLRGADDRRAHRQRGAERVRLVAAQHGVAVVDVHQRVGAGLHLGQHAELVVEVVRAGAAAGDDPRREALALEALDEAHERRQQLARARAALRRSRRCSGGRRRSPARPRTSSAVARRDQPRQRDGAILVREPGAARRRPRGRRAPGAAGRSAARPRPAGRRCAGSSATTTRPVARAFSAASRSSFGAVTTEVNSITPGMPASAITSASASVAQQTPMPPAAIWRRAMSTDLWILATGRSA